MKRHVSSRIAIALAQIAGPEAAAQLPRPAVDRPKNPAHGDFATNIALVASKKLGKKPVEIANALADKLSRDPTFTKVDVAGPGFLNLTLAPAAYHDTLREVLAAGRAYGRAPSATGERINLEFVSANPTGPLHLAHGRGAIAGDALARVLEAAGHRVVREYYVNDAGNQVRLLADSVLAKVTGGPDPEGGYGANAYVVELADWVKRHHGDLVAGASETTPHGARTKDALAMRLVSTMVEQIRATLVRLDVRHDCWASEAALHADGRVERAVEVLRGKELIRETAPDAKGQIAEEFLSTTFGDDKDRIVFKSDGGHTYFASDIAYHKDKLDRGFGRLIDVWGADHHGYIPRVSAALRALGLPADAFEVVLVQMVSLLKDGAPYRMGKRLGNFITIDEVLDEIDGATGRVGAGKDALRYYFTARRTDAQVEIDVEIAKKASLDNPVYYLQYGHARLCAILRKAVDELAIDVESIDAETIDLTGLTHVDELSIVAHLAELPDVIRDAAAQREPHRVITFATALGQSFQSYYTRLKNENDTILPRSGERADGSWKERDGGAYARKVRARLAWVRGIRDVYAAALGLAGITALERLDRAVQPSADGTAPDESETSAVD